ncbi:ribosomal-protein-alanine N-acetyltransferase [Bacillus sp. FJAT-27225]|uniref:ribosomal protein S18-alanine N-acetyltransferase n=1 Tax=Bacillus sp. FJAT-27225 TaxID=1743144 RepID=UPI00080C22DD|nr:ribosomal protein S18-alanine N-acetyltransferase [Bacillus sp. FJAT-27225]OCA88704.1 ribosomal-protein-alanine N-acetyltransferase [Bacillus sp. FJAT-27225]
MNDTYGTLSFRYMKEEDLDQIMIIEKESFTLPWSREAFYNELHHNQYAVYFVVEDKGEVIGYCGVWIVVDEAHVTNIALLPQFRGMRLGEALLRKVMDLSRQMGATSMTLEVRVSNTPARSLYKKLGFQEGGIRKKYYTDNGEDGIVMWVKL